MNNRDRTACPGLHEIGRADFRAATEVLTGAFDRDPCLHYILCDRDYEPARARRIHAYTLRVGRLYGHAFATSPACEAVSAWLPPGRGHVSTGMFIRARGLGLARSGLDVFAAIKRYGDYSDAMHADAAASPHWYLLTLAVAKEFQGKGYASRLLAPVLDLIDGRGESAYLETHNPRNVPLYERFGFKVVATGTLPGSTTTHYSMLRPPKAR